MSKISDYEKRAAGLEPKLADSTSMHQMAKAYSWYNSYRDLEDYKTYFIAWAKANKYDKDDLKILRSANKNMFVTIGPLSRLATNGMTLSRENLQFIDLRFQKICERHVDVPDSEVEEVKEKPAGPSIQEHMADSIADAIGDFEVELDKFIAGDCKKPINIEGWLEARNLKPYVLTKMGAYYSKLKAELEEVLLGKDPQLVEGYAPYKKKHVSRYLDFVSALIRECEVRTVAIKSVKKVRKKKVKTPEQLAARVKFLDKDETYTSIRPEKIIGAQTLVLYTPAHRIVHVYYADSAHGLSVKGSKVINYHKTESVMVRLRKPEEFFGKGEFVVKTRAMNNAMKAIKTKKRPVRGVLNKKTLIMGVGR